MVTAEANAELDRFWGIVERFTPSIIPLVPGTKKAAIKWRNVAPGERVLGDERTESWGLLTGARSGGLVVVDVDGDRGQSVLDDLEARWGALPDTLMTGTPSGGFHLYFTGPSLQSWAGLYGPGLDLRGEGGLIVVPGSLHRTGKIYRVEHERPIAPLPAAWAARLPPGRDRAEAAAEVEWTEVEPSELRGRLEQSAKGRRGDGWAAWRRVVLGERMFRIEGGPGEGDPVIGVDEFISKDMIFALAALPEWMNVRGEDVAAVMAPSLAILRDDVAGLGGTSKFTTAHVVEKWRRATEKTQAEAAASAAFAARLIEAATSKDATPRPPLVQLDDRFWVLDDREDAARYVGPIKGAVLFPMVERLWGDRRVIQAKEKAGLRPMTASELMSAYGAPVDRVVYDLTAGSSRVDDLTLVLDVRRDPVDPVQDREVAAWLEALGGPRAEDLISWIVWAGADRAGVSVPALALIGKAKAGKSLLADGVARAQGLHRAGPLGRALGRFGSILTSNPVLFGDEGMPRNPATGVPLTEEFRALATSMDHVIEAKGVDRPVILHGSVRVILAANRLDRLFSGRGQYGADDVAAIMRRLLVIEVGDAAALAEGLGESEGDPRRLARVAGHLRWLQVSEAHRAPPQPRAGAVARELRAGSERVTAALDALDDGIEAGDWIAIDRDRDLVWVRPDTWARRAGEDGSAGLIKSVGPYVRVKSEKRRTHPVTGAPMEGRPRWVGLSWALLREDGFLQD